MRSILLAIALGVSAAPACRTTDVDSSSLDADSDDERIGVFAHAKIEGKELSGIAIRRSASVGSEILIVSDVSYRVYSIGFKNNLASDQFYYDLKPVIPEFYRKGSSQWEAIAADKSRVFILRENPGEVFVFSGDMAKFLQAIILKVPKSSSLHKSWVADPNSRGEGMVLLKNGHILVVKEKNPVQLIEFGPQHDPAEGFKPGDSIGFDENFPLPLAKEVEFYPLKIWNLGDSSKSLITDISDLAIGPEGKLYILSDQDSRIAVIEDVLKPTESKFKIKSSWALSTKVVKPEGLIINSLFEPIVVSDSPDLVKNLFHLNAIK